MKAYVSFPMRIFCFCISGGSFLVSGKPLVDLFRVEVLKDIYSHGLNLVQFLWILFFVAILLLGITFFKQAFKTITITKSGVESSDKLGRDKLLLFDEISEIRKPWFARRGDLFVMVSKSGEKILFSKLMRNYNQIIAIIHKKTGCRLVNFPQREIEAIRTTKG
jgi:hypothetical protein